MKTGDIVDLRNNVAGVYWHLEANWPWPSVDNLVQVTGEKTWQ